MAEIHEQWVAAHAVTILAQTYWSQSPSPSKRMIDRLVAADGGHPDPTMTHSKRVAETKAIEKKGWGYPKTWLAGFVASWGTTTWQVPQPSPIATSAITARTPAATTRSTRIWPCSKRSAMSRAQWFRRSRSCVLGGAAQWRR